jgi:hypothetical protein
MNHPMIGKNCRSSGSGSGNPWRGTRADHHEHDPTIAEDLNSLFGNLPSGTDDQQRSNRRDKWQATTIFNG